MSEVLGKRSEAVLDGCDKIVNTYSAANNVFVSNRNQVLLEYILQGVANDERVYLKVSVYGINLLGLLDSGASRTILGNKGWAKIRDMGLDLVTVNFNCTVANGEKCRVMGFVRLPILLENQLKIIEVLVVPDVQHELILGVDFWREWRLCRICVERFGVFSPIHS